MDTQKSLVKVGDLVKIFNEGEWTGAIRYGIITRLAYNISSRHDDGWGWNARCIDVLWAGDTTPSRVDYVAFENGSVRVVE